MPNRKIVLTNPATKHVSDAMKELEKIAVHEPAEAVHQLVHNSKALLGMALLAIAEGDRMMQSIVMCALMLVQSANYSMENINGRLEEVVEITDELMHGIALKTLIQLPTIIARGTST